MSTNTAPKPTELTPTLASQICDRVIYGETLTAICDEPEMPTLRTVHRWLETTEAFAKELALNTYQWSDAQFDCLNKIWTKESHWNYKARNKISGAHGIPQALPATKMESIGTDWRTNPVTQITWGLSYIEKRYETPCRALVKFKRSNWY